MLRALVDAGRATPGRRRFWLLVLGLSALQHKLIGRRLVYELWEQGLIPRLLAKLPKAP
jgi:hypothetical protein